MKNITLSLSCFLFLQCIVAQPITFSTHFDLNGSSEWGYDIKQLPDSSFIMVSLSACYSAENIAGHIGCIAVFKMDRRGNVLWKNEYKDPAFLLHGIEIAPAVDGGFFIGGEADIPSKSIQKFVLKISSEGDSLWMKHYGGVQEDLISHVTSTSDGYLLLLGEIGTINMGNTWDLCLSKIDQKGNLIWQKTYGGDGFESGNHVSIDYDGGYLLGGRSSSGNPNNRRRGYVVKTDTAGNELWSKVYDFCDSETTSARISTLHDGTGYLFNCGIDSTYAGDTALYLASTMQYVRRLDIEGNTIWHYPFERLNHITRAGRPIPMKDGSVWLIGINNTPLEEGGNFSTIGWIAKLSADGELLWERRYAPENIGSFSHLTDLVETFDGGVALTGKYGYSVNGTWYNDIWLLKLDQDGCIESGCNDDYLLFDDSTVVGIEEPQTHPYDFRIFPNPAKDFFYIYTNTHLLTNIVLQLTDISGRVVKKTLAKDGLQWDVSDLEAGVYIATWLQDSSPRGFGGQALKREKVVVLK